MALTDFQRRVCRILADNRREAGDSYVAGGTALNELLASPRRSRDIDLFHDAEEAVAASWERDREALQRQAFDVRTDARPHAGDLSRRWHQLLDEAHRTIDVLPLDEIGTCVLSKRGDLSKEAPSKPVKPWHTAGSYFTMAG